MIKTSDKIKTILAEFKTGLISEGEAASKILSMMEAVIEELRNIKKILNDYKII